MQVAILLADLEAVALNTGRSILILSIPMPFPFAIAI